MEQGFEQVVGDLVEQVAVVEDQRLGAAVGLLGDLRDLLVAPVYRKGAASRVVYLPAGDWYDWWSGERVSGVAHAAFGHEFSQEDRSALSR